MHFGPLKRDGAGPGSSGAREGHGASNYDPYATLVEDLGLPDRLRVERSLAPDSGSALEPLKSDSRVLDLLQRVVHRIAAEREQLDSAIGWRRIVTRILDGISAHRPVDDALDIRSICELSGRDSPVEGLKELGSRGFLRLRWGRHDYIAGVQVTSQGKEAARRFAAGTAG